MGVEARNLDWNLDHLVIVPVVAELAIGFRSEFDR